MLENKCLSCRSCNSSKWIKTSDEYLKYLEPYKMWIINKHDLPEFNNMLKLMDKYEDQLYEIQTRSKPISITQT